MGIQQIQSIGYGRDLKKLGRWHPVLILNWKLVDER